MKKLLKSVIWSVFLASIQACGISVLDVELPDGTPKLVVEGSISNLDNPHTILLSRSTSFEQSSSQYVDDAVIIISGSGGEQDTLLNKGGGRYESLIKGIPGTTYQLDILLDGNHYQAFSTMPKPPTLDSLSISYHSESLVREEGYYLSLHTLDPEEREGYYRWIVWKNDTLHRVDGIPGFFATLDMNKENNKILNLQYPTPFRAGDTLRVHTIKMDKQVYTYYLGLYELMINDGGLIGPIPVNPETNISGDALGVFQAVSILEKEIIIK